MSEIVKLDEEINRLSQKIEEENQVELLMQRAVLYEKKHAFGEAINDYHTVLRLEPDHVAAKTRADMVKETLKHVNSNIYAHPNLHKDPWE